MKKLTAYHFEFLATEIAPMIDPAYIENDSFARTIKSFANNPRFDIARFSQKSKESWEDVNVKPDIDPDDIGVLENDHIPHLEKDIKDGSDTKAAWRTKVLYRFIRSRDYLKW